ncbi:MULTISPECIES: NAD-dependent epimerase/dehydratase family protein [Roseobacteraceae]|nr:MULTISPECIES: NAD(P)-dependent oxidoreductase [Roseobacteraceae]
MQFPDILVLGATGRIGTILQRVWTSEVVHGHVLWHTRAAPPDQGQNWISFDPLTDPDALTRAAQGRCAILCLSGVIPGREHSGATLTDNIALALVALRSAAKTGARVLLASSAAVYGNQPGLLSEESPVHPVNDYGRSKLEMERQALHTAQDLGVQCCALRIGNIAGIDSTLGGWRPGFQLDQFADGRTPLRSYISPLTLARVLADLVHAPDLPDVLNVASPGAIEMGHLLDAAQLPWTPRAPQADVIPQVCLDTTRLSQFSSHASRINPSEAPPAEMIEQWRILEPNIQVLGE